MAAGVLRCGFSVEVTREEFHYLRWFIAAHRLCPRTTALSSPNRQAGKSFRYSYGRVMGRSTDRANEPRHKAATTESVA